MSKSVIECSVDIDAPQDQVWTMICDTRRYSEWIENTDEVVTASSERADAGVTYEERNTIAGPLKGRSRWVVDVAEAPRRAVHSGEGILVVNDLRLEMELEPDGSGTRYVHRLIYTPAFGPLGPVINLGLKPSVTAATRRSLENLKAICEREARAAAATPRASASA
jgi:carbon monoxide dehydrogenase subunit G